MDAAEPPMPKQFYSKVLVEAINRVSSGGYVGGNRRIEITVETDRFLIIRRPGEPVLTWCAECSQEVSMVTPDAAASHRGISSRVIYRWIEAGQIHFIEVAEGWLLICLKSLPTITSGGDLSEEGKLARLASD